MAGIRIHDFTTPELERIRELANFTEQEQLVFDARAKGKSLTQIQIEIHCSESTVNRLMLSVKRKVDKVFKLL